MDFKVGDTVKCIGDRASFYNMKCRKQWFIIHYGEERNSFTVAIDPKMTNRDRPEVQGDILWLGEIKNNSMVHCKNLLLEKI